MRKFGLIGFPLSHSFSETYFQEKFSEENLQDCQYQNHPLKKIEKIKNLVENERLAGFNVTTPTQRVNNKTSGQPIKRC